MAPGAKRASAAGLPSDGADSVAGGVGVGLGGGVGVGVGVDVDPLVTVSCADVVVS